MKATLTQKNFREFLNSDSNEFWTPGYNIWIQKGTYGLGITKFTGRNRIWSEKGTVNDFKNIPEGVLFAQVKEALKQISHEMNKYR